MKQMSKSIRKLVASVALPAIMMAGIAVGPLQATEWRVIAGAESADRAGQALAFLPNEVWIQAGDSIRWTFPTHEKHTASFLKPGQTRPPNFGSTFGVLSGCPGVTPDGSSFDGSACVTSDVVLLDPGSGPGASPQTYSVIFPTAGNFKLVCLIHAEMTGVVHVLNLSDTLPYDQAFYDRQAKSEQAQLLAEASALVRRVSGDEDRMRTNNVAAGAGATVTATGAGSQAASVSRFLRPTIFVRVGDTVEWENLDPSINHTVTFGTEPADPRPASTNVQTTSDGARRAVIGSPTDSVNSGVLTPAPQERAGLAQAPPGVTRFRVTFTSPGTFTYICALHDDLGMNGTVIVY
jgi:plastocyanin